MKSQAGRIFEMEAEVERGDRSEQSAEDAESDVEMAGWLTHSPGAGVSQNEIDLHRRVDQQRGELARASGSSSAAAPALPVSARAARSGVSASAPSVGVLRRSSRVASRPGVCVTNEEGADSSVVRADVEAHRGIGDISVAERMRRRSQARAALDSAELRGRGGRGGRR